MVVAVNDTGAPSAPDSTSCASSRRVAIRGRSPITCTATFPMDQPSNEQPARGLGQQTDPGRAGPLRVPQPETGPQVTEPRRGQQRVTGSVRDDVAVGVSGEPAQARPKQPRDPAGPAGPERVHVHADADPGHLLQRGRERDDLVLSHDRLPPADASTRPPRD